jgi:hypothetical protein
MTESPKLPVNALKGSIERIQLISVDMSSGLLPLMGLEFVEDRTRECSIAYRFLVSSSLRPQTRCTSTPSLYSVGIWLNPTSASSGINAWKVGAPCRSDRARGREKSKVLSLTG